MSPLNGLSLDDQQSFQAFGFGPTIEPPFQCVHHAFEFHALSQPQAVAVVDFERSMTYGQLENHANCLASLLRDEGVGPRSRVCLLVERSISMLIGIIGILKAGAAYVPIDGAVVSTAALAHILADSGAAVVLTQLKFKDRVQSKRVICLEDVSYTSVDQHQVPLQFSSSSDSAYIIYTSGTTGIPKGVDVKHSNIVNLLCLSPGNLGMGPGKKVSQLMNIAFDMAAWEILGSLCNGSTLYLRGRSSKEWRAVMKIVDIVIATPSMLIPHSPTEYPNIEVVAVAGEACPQSLADKWAKSTRFFNSCGPTEVTIVNTVHAPHVVGDATSIGRPTPNNAVYILSETDHLPVPIGSIGVMWAGGAGISRGYLNLPDKTHEKFIPDPFINDGSLMFNTGDLGRWRKDGTLEHLGRIDDQVKIKGFRVELDGVAAAMESFHGVQVAAALLVDDILWGFVMPKIPNTAALKEAVAKVQPYYAVPTYIIPLEEFPRTTNNKIDKRSLHRLAHELISPMPEMLGKPDILFIHLQKVMDAIRLQTPALTIIHSDVTGSQLTDNASASPRPLVTQSTPAAVASPLSSFPHSAVEIKSEAVSSTEEGHPWAGYEDDIIPEKTQGHNVRNLRHHIFTLYRRLFGVVLVTNLAIFVSIAIRGANALRIGEIVIGNLCCAVLMRQDYVINIFFNTFCAVPPSWPLSIRRVCARVYHIGGIHSGCAVSGVIWLTLFAGQATKEVVQSQQVSIPTLVATYIILLLLLGIVIFAHPTLRSTRHDTFERVHRFAGWSATVLVWVQVVSLINDYRDIDQPLGTALVHAAPFWLLVVMTVSIILPWTRLRKVKVRSEVLSNHAVRLYFDYTTPIPGSFTRIAETPLGDWHGFATVPEPGKKGYSLIVSKAGDWTAHKIQNPPSHIWVRGVPAFGVLRIVPLFRRVVFVATGSGIGPCAPCILAQRVPIRLLWTSPNVRATFGDKFVDSILEASPGAVIYDTRAHGKPDMVKLTYRLVKEFEAEAVCIISNQKLTRKVVYGMMSRGIPAFGAIWDS